MFPVCAIPSSCKELKASRVLFAKSLMSDLTTFASPDASKASHSSYSSTRYGGSST